VGHEHWYDHRHAQITSKLRLTPFPGTYKPQIHTHYLPHLSLSFARHTSSLNLTFLLLSSDYSKSLHLQTDRSLELHTPQGCHYTTRVPRYGRDLKYDKRSAEALIPSVGVNGTGNGEIFRLNLEIGRFMKAYEVDVGGDDLTSAGGGALQGGINTGSANTAAIAEESHNLLAFGTSLGTVEFWDSRSRSRIGILAQTDVSPSNRDDMGMSSRSEITALQFHRSGLTLATGSSSGLIHLYDLRSPVPLLKKDQGYGYPIQTLTFLTPSNSSPSSQALSSEPKILSADKRIIKVWNERSGAPWTSVEPAVDLNSVAWCPDSGMILTANEGRQQHSFFIPQLGPAPKWCSFLDNLVEEMAEDHLGDPNAYNANKLNGGDVGAVYDDYKFLTLPQLRSLNLAHLIGSTNLLRPYMHGYFVAQRLYEEARVIADPFIWEEERAKRIKEKIDKERESRIRSSGNKSKLERVKVNKRLAEKVFKAEERNERRRAKRVLENGGDEAADQALYEEKTAGVDDEANDTASVGKGLLKDPRFASLFRDEDFAVDENSLEFQQLNPSTRPASDILNGTSRVEYRRTAAEEEEDEAATRKALSSSSDDSSEDSSDSDVHNGHHRQQKKSSLKAKDPDGPQMRISTSTYKKSGHQPQHPQTTLIKSRDRSFGAQVASSRAVGRPSRVSSRKGQGNIVGEKEITFVPERKGGRQQQGAERNGDGGRGKQWSRNQERRSASGNVFRKM
jgi:ribosome biogenesis protein ENP2